MIRNKLTGEYSTGSVEFRAVGGRQFKDLVDIKDQIHHMNLIFQPWEIEKFFKVAQVVELEVTELSCINVEQIVSV